MGFLPRPARCWRLLPIRVGAAWGLVAILCDLAAATPPEPPPPPINPQSSRLPITRDTWVSSYPGEVDGGNGGTARLKLKSYQEMALLDFDPAPIKGKIVHAATLHLHGADLKRVTVSAIAAEWVEGTSRDYKPQDGVSSFRWRRYPDVAWTENGGDLAAVILGNGNTYWRMAKAAPPDGDGFQSVPVDPMVIAARVAEISHGLAIFDDTGSEWKVRGDEFTAIPFPNRYIASRESGAKTAPYLTIKISDATQAAPPAAAHRDSVLYDPEHKTLVWPTQAPYGLPTIGFFVEVDGALVAQYLVPQPKGGGADTRVALPAPSTPGNHSVVVTTITATGDIVARQSGTYRAASQPLKPLPPAPTLAPANASTRDSAASAARLPTIGGCEVAIIDALDKVEPIRGDLVPSQPAGYLADNHLWSAGSRRIELCAARNEFVGFQVLLTGSEASLTAEIRWPKEMGARSTLYRYRPVPTEQGVWPDPLERLEGAFAAPDPAEAKAGHTRSALLCEIYVPHDAPTGAHEGELRLKLPSGESLELPIRLQVWDFTLPNSLSFLPEMNCYGLPKNERDYYRLAHEHRTVLNRVPYSQRGVIAEGCAPEPLGDRWDWLAWDRRFGDYFSGAAFADLPRGATPLECFYLPLHENWPTPIIGVVLEGYWADEVFAPDNRQNFAAAAREFREHFAAKGWNRTLFQCFLNNKIDFKRQGWSRGSSPWLFDEPAHWQDFWALRYFALAFNQGVGTFQSHPSAGLRPPSDWPHPAAKMVFRADISRPQWQRDALDGLIDYNVVSADAFRRYHDLIIARKRASAQLVLDYGSGNALDASNLQPVAWSLDSWSLEADGVVPWQTIGDAAAWNKASSEALFYPARDGKGPPAPSIRLKAFRRGQQDVEYLTMYALATHQDRADVGRQVRETLELVGKKIASDRRANEDAGVLDFGSIRPQALESFRRRIGQALSELKPPAADAVVEFIPAGKAINITKADYGTRALLYDQVR